MDKKVLLVYIMCGIFLFQDTLNKLLPNIWIVGYIDELLVCFLVILAIINVIKTKKINYISIIILILIIIFSFIGLLSGYLNSKFVFIDSIISNFLSIKFMLLIIALMNIEIKKKFIQYTINSMLFYSKVVMIFAMANFLFPKTYNNIFPFVNLSYRLGMPTVYSIFIHQGTYGWFMLLISGYHMSNYLINKNLKSIRKFIITALFAVLSFRTKVILGLFVLLIIAIIIQEYENIKIKGNIDKKKVAFFLLASLSVLFIFKNQLIDTYIRYFTNELGMSARQALTVKSFKIIQDFFPLGVGFGKFASFYSRIKYSEHYYNYNLDRVYGLKPNDPKFATDTYWPSIFGETGLVGSIIFISIFIIIFVYLFIQLKKDILNKNNNNNFSIFAMLVFIQSVVESSSEPIYNNSPQFIFIAFILGIVLFNSTFDRRKKINE